MTYTIKTYKDGIFSWRSDVTQETQFRPPVMALDSPNLGELGDLQDIELDCGTFYGLTASGSARRARRHIRSWQRGERNRVNAKEEVIE